RWIIADDTVANTPIVDDDQRVVIRPYHVARIQIARAVICDDLKVCTTGKNVTRDASFEPSFTYRHDAPLAQRSAAEDFRWRHGDSGPADPFQTRCRRFHRSSMSANGTVIQELLMTIADRIQQEVGSWPGVTVHGHPHGMIFFHAGSR